MDKNARTPEGLSLSLFVGDAMPTLSKAIIDPADMSVDFGEPVAGDGTVTRKSVLIDERTAADWSPVLKSPVKWDSVTFLFSDHIGMTHDPAFSDNVLFRLLEKGN